MMLPPTSKPRTRENIVPMINVVFLLLIFFLMASTVIPVPQTPVTPPSGDSDTPTQETIYLYISQSGEIEFRGKFGDEAITAMVSQDIQEIVISADRALAANDMQSILTRLSARVDRPVYLIVTPTSTPPK